MYKATSFFNPGHRPNRSLTLFLLILISSIRSTMTGTSEDPQHNHQSPPMAKESSQLSSDETKKWEWGTHVMGAPAAPTVHPDNQRAAQWRAEEHQQIYHQPYVQYSPVGRPYSNPFEPVIHAFDSWTRKAETIATNICHNCEFFFHHICSQKLSFISFPSLSGL